MILVILVIILLILLFYQKRDYFSVGIFRDKRELPLIPKNIPRNHVLFILRDYVYEKNPEPYFGGDSYITSIPYHFQLDKNTLTYYFYIHKDDIKDINSDNKNLLFKTDEKVKPEIYVLGLDSPMIKCVTTFYSLKFGEYYWKVEY